MDAPDTINPKPKIRLNLTPNFGAARSALTFYSSFHPRLTHMISLNSMSSIAQEIGLNSAVLKPRAPVEPVDAIQASSQGKTQQRMLEAVPAQPSASLPRGSLLDLRV
jgi:hypothetical protein